MVSHKRILIVEQERPVALALEGSLADFYTVYTACDAWTAKRVAANHELDAILVPFFLRGQGGLALLRQLQAMQPGVQGILMLDGPGVPLEPLRRDPAIAAVLFKPLTPADVHVALRRISSPSSGHHRSPQLTPTGA